MAQKKYDGVTSRICEKCPARRPRRSWIRLGAGLWKRQQQFDIAAGGVKNYSGRKRTPFGRLVLLKSFSSVNNLYTATALIETGAGLAIPMLSFDSPHAPDRHAARDIRH